MIRAVNLQKTLETQKVLKGLNLEIGSRETLVIIGRSGCGKSVFLKHIIGLMKPDSGYVEIDGENVSEMKERRLTELRKHFGMLFQGAALFDSLTVEENVSFALRRQTDMTLSAIRDVVREKLAMVGLKGIEHHKPAELSGGMKKRVALARAIAMEPKIILYDEPTTGLDPINADAINDLIISLQKRLDITSVAVTHDMVSAYKIASRIAMLYDGKIIETGTPAQIKGSSNPVVQQFINGRAEGPITDSEGKEIR